MKRPYTILVRAVSADEQFPTTTSDILVSPRDARALRTGDRSLPYRLSSMSEECDCFFELPPMRTGAMAAVDVGAPLLGRDLAVCACDEERPLLKSRTAYYRWLESSNFD